MKQILERLRALLGARHPEAAWRRDPLAHPDIVHMNERAKADLPFCPEAVRPE